MDVPRNTVFYEHVLDALKKLPDDFVHCVVTSPPYYGLRSYAGEQSRIWGGSPDCEHEWETKVFTAIGQSCGANPSSTLTTGTTQARREEVQKKIGRHTKVDTACCSKCGSVKCALGHEPHPDLYVSHLIEVFREVKRVLRSDGTFWLNIADSYTSHDGGDWNPSAESVWVLDSRKNAAKGMSEVKKSQIGIPDKNLIGIPDRLLLALQADGWYVRQKVVWMKCNNMPESVKGWRWEQHRIKEKKEEKYHDCPGCKVCIPNNGLVLRKGAWRPSRSYEFIFMLTKSDTYYGDGEDVREPLAIDTPARLLRGSSDKAKWVDGPDGQTQHTMSQPRNNIRKEFEESMGGAGTGFKGHSGYLKEDGSLLCNLAGRNCRAIWEFSTYGYPEGHFAVFPEYLPEKCIKISTSHKVCPKCGMQWARVIEKGSPLKEWKEKCGADSKGGYAGVAQKDYEDAQAQDASKIEARILAGMQKIITTGWKPTCNCEGNDGSARAIVLDPFLGSGTTAAVAVRMERDYIGIEISDKYRKFVEQRLAEAVSGISRKEFKQGQKALFERKKLL